MTSGSLIAQAITILVSPVLTRLFSPEELGVYALVLTAESLFGGIICGRYDVAIVSELEEEDIFPIIKLSAIISVILSSIAAIIYGYKYFISQESQQNYTYAVIFLFLLLSVNGLLRILESYNNRHREYKVMTSVYIYRTTVQNLGSVILGLLKFSVLGLLISHTFGMLVGLNKQAKTLKASFGKIKATTKKDLIRVMKKHYKQPVFSVPAVFANRFSYSSINLFIESLFGLNILGFYSISYKVLGLPLTVMSTNIAKIFFKDASLEYQKKGNFKKSFRRTSIFLLILSIPLFLGMYFVVPPLFKVIFGSGWEVAGSYVKILAPMFVFRFIVNTIAYGLQVAGKQNLELLLQTLFIIASVVSFLLTKSLNLTVEEYLRIIAATFSVVYIIYYFIVMKYALKTDSFA